MPIYEYRCSACGHDFDRLQRADAGAPHCPTCGSERTDRRISLSSFQLKGGGWYASDYKGSAGAAPPNSETAGAGSDVPAKPAGCGGGCACH